MEELQSQIREQLLQKEREVQLIKDEMAAKQSEIKKELEEKERALRDKEREMNLANEKKGAFRKMMKDVERSIAEANELSKIMNKKIRFSQYLIGIMPDTFKGHGSMGSSGMRNSKD